MTDDKRPTAGDVLDHPAFGPELQRKIERIEREADEAEFAYAQRRGMAVSKALWKRMKKRSR